MPRRYKMDDAVRVADQAAREIEAWLRSRPQTVALENVEADPDYQRVDVDLVWTTQKGRYRVEIKGDRWHKTGNFFFETWSNFEKQTPGCFLYTEADLLFYYFIEPRHLHILPMPATREWFLPRLDSFPERSTQTPIGDEFYTTVGRLVPIQRVIDEVPGCWQAQLRPS